MNEQKELSRKSKRSSLFRATSLVFVASIISAAFGLLREMLVADEFGTSSVTDAYFFASDLALSVSQFMLGGMAAALIAVYTSSKVSKTSDSGEVGSTILNTYVLALFAASIVFAITAPIVGPTLAGGFSPEERTLVVRLMWCLAPTVLFLNVALVLKSLMEAEQLFFVSQISNAFLAVCIVTSLLVFGPMFGIYSLPAGMFVGTAIQLIWASYWLRQTEFRYCFSLDLRSQESKRFFQLLWPGVVGGLIVSLIPMIDNSLASRLDDGTVACLGFAARPMSLATRFGLYALITALLPTFALKAAEEHPDAFSDTVNRTLRILIFVTLPLSFLMVALRVPIIQALFERGSFGSESTDLTSKIFAALAVGLCPMAITVALSTIFKAMQDTKTAAFVGGGSTLVSKVLFNLALILPLGAVGLALSTSLQYVTAGILLLFCMRQRLNGLEFGALATSLAKVLAASSITFLLVDWGVANANVPPLLVCFVGFAAGAGIFLVLSAILKTRELVEISQEFTRNERIRRFLPTRLHRILP